MRLFLFDIDGTLINAHGVGHHSLVYAMERVFGTAGAHEAYDWRGKTDKQIVCEIVRQAGVPEPVLHARLDECFETYRRKLEEHLGNGHLVTVLPGVPGVLERLSRRTDSLLGLLSGNVEGGAWAKLKPTGLAPFFRLAAFGSDDGDRRRLPAIARQRAQDLVKHEIPFSDIYIIGDTPLDVDCARACGAKAVAVATGQHSMEELAAVAPDLLFQDFADVEASLRSLMKS